MECICCGGIGKIDVVGVCPLCDGLGFFRTAGVFVLGDFNGTAAAGGPQAWIPDMMDRYGLQRAPTPVSWAGKELDKIIVSRLDHIFYGEATCELSGVIPYFAALDDMPGGREAKLRDTGLPNCVCPSDHVAIGCALALTSCETSSRTELRIASWNILADIYVRVGLRESSRGVLKAAQGYMEPGQVSDLFQHIVDEHMLHELPQDFAAFKVDLANLDMGAILNKYGIQLWNAFEGYKWEYLEWDMRCFRIAEWIKSCEADVLGLQEVTFMRREGVWGLPAWLEVAARDGGFQAVIQIDAGPKAQKDVQKNSERNERMVGQAFPTGLVTLFRKARFELHSEKHSAGSNTSILQLRDRSTGDELIVGNVHLIGNPEFVDKQQEQLRKLLEGISCIERGQEERGQKKR